MTPEEYQWHINLVKDRHQALDLTFEQAEKVYKYEQEKVYRPLNIKENGNEYSTHSGTVGTYYTTVQIDRKKGIGYIIFTNSLNNNTQQGVRLLMRKLKEVFH